MELWDLSVWSYFGEVYDGDGVLHLCLFLSRAHTPGNP
jgi:hypothetical protein